MNRSKQDIFEIIQCNEAAYAFFEVWLDYVEDINKAFIDALVRQWPDRIILLFRRQNLEPMHLAGIEREQHIASLHKIAVYLDLDISSQKADLDYIRDNNIQVKTIVSYHNYQETPSDRTLRRILTTIETYHPTIFKVATFCHSEQDAMRLLELQLWFKKEHKKHIILGMGPHGAITRIFGTVWGNELIFAPVIKAEQSAPGQLTKQQLDIIFFELSSIIKTPTPYED
jgi:3-dehydroquinate dehydratase type I